MLDPEFLGGFCKKEYKPVTACSTASSRATLSGGGSEDLPAQACQSATVLVRRPSSPKAFILTRRRQGIVGEIHDKVVEQGMVCMCSRCSCRRRRWPPWRGRVIDSQIGQDRVSEVDEEKRNEKEQSNA